MAPEQRMLDQILFETFERANDPEYGSIRLRALLATILVGLEEAGHITDPRIADFKDEQVRPALECHGYALDTDDDVLSIYFCIDGTAEIALNDAASVLAVSKESVKRGFKRLEAFVQRARTGRLDGIEPADPASELVALVRGAEAAGQRIELNVVTTGRVSERAAVSESTAGLAREVWDIVRLAKVCGGTGDEGIAIDFVKDYGQALPCLVTPKASDEIQVYMTCIPAMMLASIYNTHRGRLLERNIRSFLQFTSKVNAEIRLTLLNTPERFLAYNNGLSATASGLELEAHLGDLARIRSVQEFQIVNGGQTTASIATCVRRDRADLSAVTVPMKLTVVPASQVDELVPKIARYANTQNRIQEADLAANHAWHVELERLSRTTWTAPTAEAPRGARWFFERSRGQYADELASIKTPAAKRTFKAENPARQKFVKTDVAKFLLSWDQEPNVVCLGAQKCFAEMMRRFNRERRAVPDLAEFKRLVVLGMLFRTAEKLYGDLGFQGYRAQVVSHSIALLSNRMQRRLSWDEIWELQGVPAELTAPLKKIIVGVREVLTNTAGRGNITEWSKKAECWEAVCGLSFQLDLPGGGSAGPSSSGSGSGAGSTGSQRSLIEAVAAVSDSVWFEVSGWAKQTKTLLPWQRSLAFSLGRNCSNQRKPTIKQATQGRRLLLEAKRLGFGHSELTAEIIERLTRCA